MSSLLYFYLSNHIIAPEKNQIAPNHNKTQQSTNQVLIFRCTVNMRTYSHYHPLYFCIFIKTYSNELWYRNISPETKIEIEYVCYFEIRYFFWHSVDLNIPESTLMVFKSSACFTFTISHPQRCSIPFSITSDCNMIHINSFLDFDLNRTPNCYGKTWRFLCPFSGISTCGRTSRETVSHPQCPPLPTLC